MKAILKAIALWIHIHIAPLQDEGFVPKLYRIALAIEAKSGPVPVVINGDSVVAAGRNLFSQLAGVRVVAIPGLKINGVRGNMFAFVAPAQPTLYIFDGGGNDFIAGRDPDEVFKELREAIIDARAALGQQCTIYWINIVPVGPKWPALAANIRLFNLRVKLAGFVKIIDIHSRLSGEDGFLRPEYRAPDEIHNTPAAYDNEWFPAIKEVVEAHR
jgi:hypothetical protein